MKLKLVLQIHLHIISTISDGSTIYFDYTKEVELNLKLASTKKLVNTLYLASIRSIHILLIGQIFLSINNFLDHVEISIKLILSQYKTRLIGKETPHF